MFQLFLLLCTLSISYAARTPLEIRQYMLSKSMECTTDHMVSSAELQMLLNHQFPDTKSSKCFINCVLKKFGWIDAKGLYVLEAATKFAEEEYNDEPAQMESAKKVFEICKTVNDETTSDGETGCDRANSLAKCLIDNAMKNGFNLQLGGD